jgi:sn-glycerol 3-phosphate transport system permease protein
MTIKRGYTTVLFNMLILCVGIAALFPLLWIIITAMKSQTEALKNPFGIFPAFNMFMYNLREVWARADWPLYYRNSLVLVTAVWAAQLLIAIPAAYAFAVFRFRCGRLFFLLILVRLLISPESAMLANYLTVVKLGAYDSLAGIALPYLVSAQAVFLFRQGFKQMPSSLRDSARMDGCGDFRFIMQIGLPVIKPFIVSFSVISGVFQWNAFFWPMLVTRSPSLRIVSAALAFFGMQAESGAEWPLTMTAVLMVIAPLLAAFIVFQKKFMYSFMKVWTNQ